MTLQRTLRGLRMAVRFDRAQILAALVFGLAAAACRSVLIYTETRSQLLVMFAMLAALELGPRGDRRRGFQTFALNCAAVAIAVLAVKFWIEGRPHLHPTLALLQRLISQTVATGFP